MASAFSNLRQMVDNFIGGDDSPNESDYTPTSPTRKRKASDDLRRSSKSGRYSRPQFTLQDYATSNFWEGVAERRTSKATLLGAGVNTLVMDSGTESGYATPVPSKTFSMFNQKKKLARKGSPGKPASPERVGGGKAEVLGYFAVEAGGNGGRVARRYQGD
jgi:hypothetical protein